MTKNDHINQKQFKRQRGQSLLELALLMPLILLLVMGALEFGRLIFTQIVITNAAREGAYYVSRYPLEHANGILAASVEAENSGIPEIQVTVHPQNCCEIGQYSMVVTVETQVPNLLFMGLFERVLTAEHNGAFPLSASVEMMVQ